MTSTPLALAEAPRTARVTPSVTPDADALLPALKALADPVRLRIVLHIAGTSTTVCACSMPQTFGVSQPTMSHHLKRLVEAGLLDREMRGSWAHFSIRPEGFAALSALTGALTSAQPQECCDAC
ncbi:ArsR/SmtB family transcription factor [Actinomyces haliotis]|uniref:ArsR/SmtB family transcription factor n=1 Tax=Actinomyces haliotis TaxID=1280843 RepID=UPI00188F3149|nr:metalloregulator ArsR/SmtB family transcription factor [Actinomyces haliotis]